MKLLKFWKPITLAIIIFYGSVTSGSNLNIVPIFNIKNFDKVIHFSFYMILSISFLASLYRTSKFKKSDQKLITLILVISYGLIMEVFQYYFTYDRSAEFIDAIANTFGSILGVLLFPYLIKFKLFKFL